MGRVGENPILQVGGVQDAITADAPTDDAPTVATLPKVALPLSAVTPTEVRFEELQVNGTPVIVLPKESMTVASTVVVVPVGTTNEVLLSLGTERVISCTAQVTKL